MRLRKYSIFDVGRSDDYFDDEKNREILRKVASKCYLPANKLMLDILKSHPEFRISFSFSGVFLEQCELFGPEIIESFKKLVATGRVEVLAETYYHSLSYLYSKDEFKDQVIQHSKIVKRLFGVEPLVFRNTELIYNNELAKFVEGMGYKGIIAEGWEPHLGEKSPYHIYTPHTASSMKLLLKSYKLSDDIAFRFSNKGWTEHPLSSEKFASWVSRINGAGECVNLFMDYETFGEHQWEDTGIFEFMRNLPSKILAHPDNSFATPSELVESLDSRGVVDVHNFISWADMERDLSAWLGNRMQKESIKRLYDMEDKIKASGDKKLLEAWRRLQTSDHFYYMCTKWFSDGDVHKYFSPYDSPYDSFIIFNNIMNDLGQRIKIKADTTKCSITNCESKELKTLRSLKTDKKEVIVDEGALR